MSYTPDIFVIKEEFIIKRNELYDAKYNCYLKYKKNSDEYERAYEELLWCVDNGNSFKIRDLEVMNVVGDYGSDTSSGNARIREILDKHKIKYYLNY